MIKNSEKKIKNKQKNHSKRLKKSIFRILRCVVLTYWPFLLCAKDQIPGDTPMDLILPWIFFAN